MSTECPLDTTAAPSMQPPSAERADNLSTSSADGAGSCCPLDPMEETSGGEPPDFVEVTPMSPPPGEDPAFPSEAFASAQHTPLSHTPCRKGSTPRSEGGGVSEDDQIPSLEDDRAGAFVVTGAPANLSQGEPPDPAEQYADAADVGGAVAFEPVAGSSGDGTTTESGRCGPSGKMEEESELGSGLEDPGALSAQQELPTENSCEVVLKESAEDDRATADVEQACRDATAGAAAAGKDRVLHEDEGGQGSEYPHLLGV